MRAAWSTAAWAAGEVRHRSAALCLPGMPPGAADRGSGGRAPPGNPRSLWRRIFDFRRMLNLPALKGIYRYHEFIGPVIPLEAVVYLGEAHTPLVAANSVLRDRVGMDFYFKNDGQNPSASFKDRGMASALSYINAMIRAGSSRRSWRSAPPPATPRPPPPSTGPIWRPGSSPPCSCPTRRSPPSSSGSRWAAGPPFSKSPGCSTTA
jgi:hypothetical protein